jgi:hypothetical protein
MPKPGLFFILRFFLPKAIIERSKKMTGFVLFKREDAG